MIMERDNTAAGQFCRFRYDVIRSTVTAAEYIADVYVKPLNISGFYAFENFPRVIR